MDIDFGSLKSDSDTVSCDRAGHFFVKSPIIRRALWSMWNEEHEGRSPAEVLDRTQDFDICDPWHLAFLEQLLDPIDDRQSIRLLLEYCREYAFYSWYYRNSHVVDIQESYKDITAFILTLDWLERNVNTYQNIWSLLSTKVATILGQEDFSIIPPQHYESVQDYYDEEDDEETWEFDSFEVLSYLPQAGFSPIDQEWQVVYIANPYPQICEYAEVKLFYETDGGKDERIIINKIWKHLVWSNRYKVLAEDTRKIIHHIDDVFDHLKIQFYDTKYLKEVCEDLGVLLDIESETELEKQGDMLEEQLKNLRAIYETRVQELESCAKKESRKSDSSHLSKVVLISQGHADKSVSWWWKERVNLKVVK